MSFFSSLSFFTNAQAQLGLPYPNATPTFTLAYSDRVVAARTLPPQYAAALARGVAQQNLTDAEVYRPLKAAVTPLLAAAPAQVTDVRGSDDHQPRAGGLSCMLRVRLHRSQRLGMQTDADIYQTPKAAITPLLTAVPAQRV